MVCRLVPQLLYNVIRYIWGLFRCLAPYTVDDTSLWIRTPIVLELVETPSRDYNIKMRGVECELSTILLGISVLSLRIFTEISEESVKISLSLSDQKFPDVLDLIGDDQVGPPYLRTYSKRSYRYIVLPMSIGSS